MAVYKLRNKDVKTNKQTKIFLIKNLRREWYKMKYKQHSKKKGNQFIETRNLRCRTRDPGEKMYNMWNTQCKQKAIFT